MIGCGGWSGPLLLAAFYISASTPRAWNIAFYFLALLLNYPHFMATVYRAYHTSGEFAKYRIFTVHVALLLALAGVIAHLWYPLVPWIVTLYVCWSPWHYTGQNFGLLMMFARRNGVAPTHTERLALHLAFIASFILLMLGFHTGSSGDPLILSLGLPFKFTLPARAALSAFFVAASISALGSMARRSRWRAIIPLVMLAATQFLWFLAPALIEIATGWDVPQTRYSSGILAVLHSAQYLWITSYYQRREAHTAGVLQWKFSAYFVTLIVGGIALFIPGPWIVSRVFHADFAASFLLFTALVNIHHFILDGALWKLRDSRIASLLLNTESKTDAQSATSGNAIISAARWLAAPSKGARTVRIGAVITLFAWAAMDQIHFYWSSGATNLTSLQYAALLNPDDSAIQVRLARAANLAGKKEMALAALQQAAAVSAGNFSLQESYARGLIEAGRDSEAYAQYVQILTRWPKKVDAHVNQGLLAARLGRTDEAVDHWERAIDLDPSQANAQLYLGEALDQRGEMQAAARHYRAFLQIVAAHPNDYRGEATSVLSVLIKIGDADAITGRQAEALQSYQTAANYARESGNSALESLTLIHLADLQEKQNHLSSAARSFQQALTLDSSLSDRRAVASDWVNYGQFLHRHGQSERLVLVCFLYAEKLLKDLPGEELSAVAEARRASESLLSRGDISKVRGAIDFTVNEARNLLPEKLEK